MTRVDQPLRILHLTSDSAPGGVSRYLHDLCWQLHRRGHEVAIAGGRGQWHALFDKVPWPWLEMPLDGGVGDLWWSFKRLRAYCHDHGVDLLHAHYRKSMLVARGLSRSLGLPQLSTLHLTDIAMSPVHRWLTCFGDHVHAPSERAKQWLVDTAGVAPDRITVIAHGVDPERFPVSTPQQRAAARAAMKIPDDAVVAAYAGRLAVVKQVSWLVDLAQAARNKLPQLVVLLVGQGDQASNLRQQIEALGLKDRVVLLPYGDPLPVYQAADAVLLPSAREGFSLMALEAMSVGRPVLRTDTAGTDEQIVPGRTGCAVPIDRERFIDEAMRFLADRPALGRMGQAAAKHVREHLTIEHQVEQTLALYRRLVG